MTDREFSRRDVPWAQAGVLTTDAKTAAEAAELGGLNFEVELRESGFVRRDGEFWPNGRFDVVRTDTQRSLATVGSHYRVLNFGEAFDFMDEIDPRYVAAGVRRGGREGYMVVQAPEHLRIDLLDGEDPTDLYLVLRTSHDGSKQVEAAVLALRNKCTNMTTLRGFSRGAKQRWGIAHTSTMPQKLAEAKMSLRNMDTYVDDLETTARRLADIDLELAEARKVIEWALAPKRPKTAANVSAILDLYERSPLNGYGGTGWGLVNATTEWLDHHRDSKSDDARFINGLAGYGHKTTNRVAARLLTRGG